MKSTASWYLFIVFGLLVLHEWVVLSNHHISYKFYGFALLKSLILAKIILLAEGLNFARRFEEKPIAYPIAYKSVAFTVLLMGAYILEEVLVGTWHGKSMAQSMPPIGDGTIWAIFAVSTIMCFALLPFFAFREIGRRLGEDELHALLFSRGAKALARSHQWGRHGGS